ncbi:MAG: hypothetical protein GY703_08300 [Gammaproteobacteria bacterium]|nr:hypothetical protein [Gammaproteobacteria bacterium]
MAENTLRLINADRWALFLNCWFSRVLRSVLKPVAAEQIDGCFQCFYLMSIWPSFRKKRDPRLGRLVVLIECLLNQNARDLGAAESPGFTRDVIELLVKADIGMVQIPCPEIACLGFKRQRAPGESIREAMETPESGRCCQRLAECTTDRIQCYLNQGYEVLAVLGGNEKSPGCAVHNGVEGEISLSGESGVFMQKLAQELRGHNLTLKFRGMRDADPALLKEDLAWLSIQVGM